MHDSDVDSRNVKIFFNQAYNIWVEVVEKAIFLSLSTFSRTFYLLLYRSSRLALLFTARVSIDSRVQAERQPRYHPRMKIVFQVFRRGALELFLCIREARRFICAMTIWGTSVNGFSLQVSWTKQNASDPNLLLCRCF